MSRWNPRIVLPRPSTIAGYPTPVALIIGLGVICRVGEYLWGRSLWLDESSLATNFSTKTFSGLFGPLLNVQLAPPGFLVVEWLVAHGLAACRSVFPALPFWYRIGAPRFALRVVPLLSAIASLFLFERVASRVLSRRGALIALGLFAVADDLVYYAAEVKQYSSDVALGLACYLAAFAACEKDLAPRRFALLAFFSALVVWFSYAAVFVLAGTGVVALGSELLARRWRRAGSLALLGLVAAASAAGVYFVSRNQLGHRGDMWVFWNFAFPPAHINSAWDASWPLRRVLYLFVNPLNFNTPLGPGISAIIPVALFISGVLLLARRNARLCAMLIMPGAFALLACVLRLYPFHGRLVLFLVPSLLLFIAEGADRIRVSVLRWVVLAALFVFPTLTAAVQLVEQRPPRAFNPRGDLRPADLDPNTFPLRTRAE